MARARIVGTGAYAPAEVVTNEDLSRRLAELGIETSDDWIRTRTGIEQRRFARLDEQTSDMAVEASKRALEMADISPSQLDLIVMGTISGDMGMPACATFVQRKLGATCPAFDVSAACAGSLYGLSVADAFIRAGNAKNVLVIGAELLSRLLDWEDRNTCVLFGDAAGAMLLRAESDDAYGVLHTTLGSDGTQTDILKIPGAGSIYPMNDPKSDRKLGFVHMNGREVFKFAVRTLTQTMQDTLRAASVAPEELDWVVPHQANIRIVNTVVERLAVPEEKLILNIDRFGNTSSASVPITLDEGVRSGKIQPGHLVGMMAIGSGMSWGSAIIRW